MNLSCVCAEFNGTEEDMGVATEDIEEITLDEDVLMESESSQDTDLSENGKIKTVISSQDHTFNHPGIFKTVLKDEYGNPLEGANVSFLINGITYYRICDENGVANMNINLWVPGSYSVNYYYSGDDNYLPSSGLAFVNIVNNKLPSYIKAADLSKYHGDSETFDVYLTDNNNQPMINTDVTLTINGVTYIRTTDDLGIARLNITLMEGTYHISFSFTGNEYYTTSSSSAQVTVNRRQTTLHTEDLTKYFGDSDYFAVLLTDYLGNPMVNKSIFLTVNGVTYERITNSSGYARLNINLNPGNYVIYSHFYGDAYYKDSDIVNNINVVLKSTTLIADNFVKYFGDSDQFTVRLIDYQGLPLSNKNISIMINGITYIKTTDNQGQVKLNINLNECITTAYVSFQGDLYYSSSTTSVVITVKRHGTYLTSQNIVSYNGSQAIYEVGLFDDNDNPIVNETILITINGVLYDRITDERGIATLNINLPVNNYTVNCTFVGSPYYVSSTKIHTLEVYYLSPEFSDISTVIDMNEPFSFTLTLRNEVCNNQEVVVSVNNKNYTAITNEFGVGQVFLNLTPGFWDVSLTSLGVNYKKSVVSGSIYVNYTRKSVDLLDVIESAVLLKDYINENYNLPSYFSVSGTMMNIYDFSYAMASAIVKINDGNTSDILIPFIYKVEPYVDSNSSTDASLDTFITMIRNIILFTELNNYLPINFSIYSSAIDFKTYTYGFSEILSYYNLTNKLPEHYQFNTDIYKSLNHVYDSTIVDLSQIGSGLNELNNDTNLNKYLVNDTYCKISQEILSIANTITEGYNTTLDKVNAIMEYSSSIPYYSYPGQFGVDWVLENNKANYVDTTNLIVALCRAINVPARFNAATVDFASGNSYYHVWAQILVGDWWYVADGTSSRNSLSVVNSWDPDSITNLTQGNLYTNLSVVYPFYELVPVNYSHIDYTFNDNVEIDFGYNVSYIDNKSAVIPSLNTKFIFENNIVEYGCEYFVVQLTDVNNIPLVNKKVKINIENQYYDFLTDFEGRIFLNLDLIPQTYELTLLFDGDDNHYSCSGSADLNIIKSASYINPLKNKVSSGEKYYIELKDSVGNPIINKTVQLTINNETHQLTTDIMGYASLDILLNAGSYEIIGYFDGNDRYNSSFFSSVLNVGYKTKLVYDELLLHNGDEYSVKLVDYLGNPLINKEVFFKIINSNLNIVNNYSLITNSNGIITDFINVSSPGIYEVFCYFNGSNEYFESYGIFDIEVVPDDIRIKVSLITDFVKVVHRNGEYIEGNLVDSIGNPVKNVSLILSFQIMFHDYATYNLVTDEFGYFKFNINSNFLNNSKIIVKFYGDEKYNFMFHIIHLRFSYSPNFSYMVNITTVNKYVLEGNHLNIPYAREIGIYKNGALYKFSYGCLLEGTTLLKDNEIYFISLDDNNPIKILNSERDITSKGFSLFGNGFNVLIKYWGYFESKLDSFNVLFNGKEYDGRYISNTTFIQNGAIIASLYFSSEIFTSVTREYIYDITGISYSNFDFASLVYTEFDIFEDNYFQWLDDVYCNSTFVEELYYGNTNFNNKLYDANWSPNLGYEAVESFLITNEKVTDEILENYLNKSNNYSGPYKFIYENFLTALGFRWLVDKLAEEISEKYNLNWNINYYNLIGSSTGINGRSLDSIDSLYFNGRNSYEIVKGTQEYSFKVSLLEQYIIGAHGLNSSCAVSEIMKAILSGNTICLSNSSQGLVISMLDNSSKLEFHNTGYIASIINSYFNITLNGGVSFGGFSFTDTSNILNALNKLLHPVSSFIMPAISELDKSLSANPFYSLVKDYAIDFLIDSAGSLLFNLGIRMMVIPSPVTICAGALLTGVGFAITVYNNGLIEQPFNKTRHVNFFIDFGANLIGGNLVKYVSKFGLEGASYHVFNGLVTTWETIIAGSTKEIIRGLNNRT